MNNMRKSLQHTATTNSHVSVRRFHQQRRALHKVCYSQQIEQHHLRSHDHTKQLQTGAPKSKLKDEGRRCGHSIACRHNIVLATSHPHHAILGRPCHRRSLVLSFKIFSSCFMPREGSKKGLRTFCLGTSELPPSEPNLSNSLSGAGPNLGESTTRLASIRSLMPTLTAGWTIMSQSHDPNSNQEKLPGFALGHSD